MEIEGIIKVIGETQTFGEKGFRKRELVVTTVGEYPQHISVEFLQDKSDLLDKFKVGQNVKVNTNINGREWINPDGVSKYFNSIVGWRIELLSDSSKPQLNPQQEQGEDLPEDEDLPF